jgi:hypothetical protein
VVALFVESERREDVGGVSLLLVSLLFRGESNSCIGDSGGGRGVMDNDGGIGGSSVPWSEGVLVDMYICMGVCAWD